MQQPLPTEIVMLAIAVVLLLVQLFMQSVSATMEMGGDYKAGPRDEPRMLQGVFAGRAERAFRNLLETFPVFAALALALVVTGRNWRVGSDGRRSLGGAAVDLSAALFRPDSLCAQPGVVRLDVRAGRHALASGSVALV